MDYLESGYSQLLTYSGGLDLTGVVGGLEAPSLEGGGATIGSVSSNVLSNPIVDTRNPEIIREGVVGSQWEIGRQAFIIGGATGYNEGTGFFLGWDSTTYKFFIGNSAGDKLTWDGSTLSITGTITVIAGSIAGLTITATALTATAGGNSTIVSSGSTAFTAGPTGSPTFTVTQAGLLTTTSALIGGWNVVDGYIYNLQSGTPTATPNDGVVLASGNEALLVYEDTALRAELGYLSAGVYGLKIYATNGSTVIFEASDTQQMMGGWIFDDQYLYKLVSGTPTSSPNDGIVIGSGSTPAVIAYEDTAKRAEMGYLSAGVFGFKGYATNGTTVIFEMSDTQQRIGGWYFTDTVLRSATTDAASNIFIDSANGLIRAGITTGDYLTLDGANLRLRSSNYVSGPNGAGFTLEPDLLEVGNIAARGIIRTAVFEKDVISAVGGSFAVIDSDKLNVDMTALDASTLTISGNTTFAVGDILRIKDGVDDEWFEVTNIGSAPTYTVTRDKAAAYAANTNPAWANGASVVNYQQSGDGLIYMTASESNAPYLAVLTHAGSPWSALTTRLRLGNLNGYLGYVADIYGLGVGSSSAGEANITIEPTNGIRMRSGTTTLFQIDMSGGATIAGWNIVDGYIYNLQSGTPTSSPNDGIVLASGNEALIVYEDTAKRVEVGYLSAGVYGLKGYATDGSTVIFEFSDAQQVIAGWSFTNQQLSSGSVTINGSTERILLGAATAPLTGIGGFIGKDGSDYEFRFGDPAGRYIHWDGTLLTIVGDSINANTTLQIGGVTVTSSAAELNVLDGVSANVTATNLNTLTAGDTSDATELHEHPHSWIFGTMLPLDGSQTIIASKAGFSDATTKIISVGVGEHGTGDDVSHIRIPVSTDIGKSPYVASLTNYDVGASSNDVSTLFIGANSWISDTSNSQILKDGAGVTISGTARYGVLGHDIANSYLLVMYSTTLIARFSGIAGTTITNINSNITLDTAVTQTGFCYDEANDRYICVDATNNVLRRFNSSGTTIDTVAYTVEDTNITGCCIIEDRVYLIIVQTNDDGVAGGGNAGALISFVPTNMTR